MLNILRKLYDQIYFHLLSENHSNFISKLQASTTENLAVYIWESLKEKLEKPELLYEVKIFETDKNIITYRGQKTKENCSKNVTSIVSSDSD